MPVIASGNLAVALNTAFRGWHVVPLRPGTKIPIGHVPDRCPRTGPCADGHRAWEDQATNDLVRVEAHWRHHPQHGVGIATGPSNLLVVDLDMPKPSDPPLPADWQAEQVRCGADVLAVLARRADTPVPRTHMVRTRSGGWHLYYTPPAGIRLPNSNRRLGPWIDTRGWGGQVVAAGTHIAGRPYTRVRDLPIAPLDPTLFQPLLTPDPPPPAPRPAPPRPIARRAAGRRAAYLAAALDRQTAHVADAPGGQRNKTLYIAAQNLGQLVATGALTEQEVTDRLKQGVAQHIGIDDFTWTEVDATIRSGLRAGARRPRQAPA